MKVGKDVESDIRRLEAVHRALPGISFIGDGNQGFSRQDCLTFAQGVKRFGGTMMLLEQPVVRDDLDSMAAIRRETGIPVAADESVRSLADAQEVVARGAADYINIKIMKTGVAEAVEIASFTKASGLKLMIGGMLETRIAMGCSFSLVLGLGGFDVLDLDTPLLLASDPVTGGYRYDGSRLQPWSGPGLDMNAEPLPERHHHRIIECRKISGYGTQGSQWHTWPSLGISRTKLFKDCFRLTQVEVVDAFVKLGAHRM